MRVVQAPAQARAERIVRPAGRALDVRNQIRREQVAHALGIAPVEGAHPGLERRADLVPVILIRKARARSETGSKAGRGESNAP